MSTLHQPAIFSTPSSAYIHLPFCRHRCGYCSFTVAAGRDHLIPRYLTALDRELGRLSAPFELETLYLGGGTPSRLNPEQLRRLRTSIASRFQLLPGAEVTLEANPCDITDDWIAAAIDFGATRISLGAQSFRTEKLRQLERDHDGPTICRVVKLLKAAQFRVSLDLIFAVPEESPAQWSEDLAEALDLPLDHLSTYELTYEKGTRFWNRLQAGQLQQQDEDQRTQLYGLTLEKLATAGWEHYEVSSFARPGSRCRHNLVYWSGSPYFAFGAGASRFLAGVRSTNHLSTMRYLQRIEANLDPCGDRTELPLPELARELLAIGLRRISGVDEADFQRVTGLDFQATAGEQVAELEQWGLVEYGPARLLRLSRRGLFLYDAVASRIATGD